MRAQLGCLTFLLAVGFAGAMLLCLVGNAWYGVDGEKAFIGFFGFGIPMIAAGVGAAALWLESKKLQRTLGWSSTVFGLVCGVCLFLLVAGWVGLKNSPAPSKTGGESAQARDSQPGILQFFGFGIPTLLCGGFGIVLLLESEGKGPGFSTNST